MGDADRAARRRTPRYACERGLPRKPERKTPGRARTPEIDPNAALSCAESSAAFFRHSPEAFFAPVFAATPEHTRSETFPLAARLRGLRRGPPRPRDCPHGGVYGIYDPVYEEPCGSLLNFFRPTRLGDPNGHAQLQRVHTNTPINTPTSC